MLKKIKSWFTANKLTLNISKTSYILFAPKRQMQETCLTLYFQILTLIAQENTCKLKYLK